jgi:hypothetical protein
VFFLFLWLSNDVFVVFVVLVAFACIVFLVILVATVLCVWFLLLYMSCSLPLRGSMKLNACNLLLANMVYL